MHRPGAMVQIYQSLLTFFSSLSSSRYFKFPNSTQQQKKTYHKAIKQSQTVYEQSPNQLARHHMYRPRPIKVHRAEIRSPKVTHFQMLVSRGGAGKDTERKDQEPYSAAITALEKTEYWSLIPSRISLV